MTTLTEAPALSALAELCHEWRHVAAQVGQAEEPIWNGDLADREMRMRFKALVSVGQVIVVQRRIDGGFLIFAKMAARVDPFDAYERSATLGPKYEKAMTFGRAATKRYREKRRARSDA